MRECERVFGIQKDTLRYNFKKLGIAIRSKTEQLAVEYAHANWRDKDALYREYVEKGNSTLAIAEMWGCDRSVVRDWLIRFGIPLRGLSESHVGNEPPNKGQGKKNSGEKVACACGCGQLTHRYSEKSCERRFAPGHRLRGEAHPQFIQDTDHKRHDRSEYREWRRAVLARCNYTCSECGQVGGKLQSHHVAPFSKFPALRFEVSNGRAVCGPCHKVLHKAAKEVLA